MSERTTDLSDAAAPEEIPAILRKAAEGCYESAGMLEAAWSDKNAGSPWVMIAKALERCADSIEKKL